MSLQTDFSWIIQLLDQYLSARVSVSQLSKLSTIQPKYFEDISHSINDSLSLYNSFPSCLANINMPGKIFINAKYLKSIHSDQLPSYSKIITKLKEDKLLLDATLSEMRDSTYFHHIYMIEDPLYLLSNLMTLIYRCSILAIYPKLREQKAQISSTIEEMSALNHLLGHETIYYKSVKHWLLDWEGEGFSEELAELIKSQPSFYPLSPPN